MTDEEALLAAIAAAPRDDAPRLVYADWLQERGQDAKSEYVRAVVKLLHPPEDPAALARCLALAGSLDAGWRQRAGGRFEVVLDGAIELLYFAYLVGALLKMAFNDSVNLWQKGQPVRLRASLTREDAEEFKHVFAAGFPEPEGQQPLRLIVRPMEDDTSLSLFAPLPPRSGTVRAETERG